MKKIITFLLVFLASLQFTFADLIPMHPYERYKPPPPSMQEKILGIVPLLVVFLLIFGFGVYLNDKKIKKASNTEPEK